MDRRHAAEGPASAHLSGQPTPVHLQGCLSLLGRGVRRRRLRASKSRGVLPGAGNMPPSEPAVHDVQADVALCRVAEAFGDRGEHLEAE